MSLSENECQSTCANTHSITDDAVIRLVRSCTRLRYVDLASECTTQGVDADHTDCSQLTDLSVIALATSLPKLRRVGLVKVVNITDYGIETLAERGATLERLHLSYCDNISLKAISFLLNRLPLLMHLSLTGVTAFKTPELQQFCRPPPEVRPSQDNAGGLHCKDLQPTPTRVVLRLLGPRRQGVAPIPRLHNL